MRVISKLWWGLIRFGFRLLYNEMAFTYNLVANIVSLGQWWEWQRSALPYLPPPTEGLILELAHGTGRLQVDLHQGGWRSVACDLSPAMGRIAARLLHKKNVPARLIRANAQHLPFPDRSFAAILSTFPTPFIIEPATLQEARRVLGQGKRLIIVPNGVLAKQNLAERALELAYQITGQRGDQDFNVIDHFAAHGFDAKIEFREFERSTAQIIIAQVR